MRAGRCIKASLTKVHMKLELLFDFFHYSRRFSDKHEEPKELPPPPKLFRVQRICRLKGMIYWERKIINNLGLTYSVSLIVYFYLEFSFLFSEFSSLFFGLTIACHLIPSFPQYFLRFTINRTKYSTISLISSFSPIHFTTSTPTDCRCCGCEKYTGKLRNALESETFSIGGANHIYIR